MIDVNDSTIQRLVAQGFKVAAHAYLRPDGQIKHQFSAKHPGTGQLLQGWCTGGSVMDALRDLARRAGMGCSAQETSVSATSM